MLRCLIIICICSALLRLDARAQDLPPDKLAAAHKIYISKCSRCHKFYDPPKYDEGEWRMWMGKMRKKAKLNAADYELLLKYTEQLRRAGESPAEPSHAPSGGRKSK